MSKMKITQLSFICLASFNVFLLIVIRGKSMIKSSKIPKHRKEFQMKLLKGKKADIPVIVLND
jgi:hypothetical protein